MFDNLFDSGEIEPCIIVCTTYYFDVEKDVETRKKTGIVPAGDNDSTGMVPNFYREVVENIIPAVELKFHTYLKDRSRESIRATRDYRGFSEYSRGACCTWYMFHNAFEYFRWYAPMSCMTTAGHNIFTEVSEEEVTAYVTFSPNRFPELPFYIYASNGDPEKDIKRMNDQMQYLTRRPEFRYGTDQDKHNLYYSISQLHHTDLFVPYYYWNSLKVLFKL